MLLGVLIFICGLVAVAVVVKFFSGAKDGMTVIEIKPHRWGWEANEGQGVQPAFPDKEAAISYVTERHRTGEIRVLDSAGNVEQVIRLERNPNLS